jgi:hypothetical protein
VDFFDIGSGELFAQAGFKPDPPDLHLLSYRCEQAHSFCLFVYLFIFAVLGIESTFERSTLLVLS